MGTNVRFLMAALVVGALANAPDAAGQYIYLDADGDGVNCRWCEWPPYADTTSVDVYIVTDKNLDGSPAVCDSGDHPLDLQSYTLNILGGGAPFEVVSIENEIPTMVELFPPVTNAYGVTVGYSTGNWLAPGTHHLLRLKVIFGRGCPNMTIVSSSCYSPPGVATEFVSSCSGSDWDNTFPLEGLGFGFCTDPPNRRPTVDAPSEVAAMEGLPVSFPVIVTDPECGLGGYLSWFSGRDLPAGATLTGLSSFAYGRATATFSWTPSVGQAGEYFPKFVAHDPDTWNIFVDPDVTATTHITVAPASTLSTEQAPTARAGGPYAGQVLSPIEFRGSDSSDPEGGALQFSWAFGDGATGDGISAAHAFASVGVYDVTLTVIDRAGLTSQDHTIATITDIVPGAATLIESVAPNPMTPRSVLEFTTTKEGFARAWLFDIRGRLVARPLDSTSLGAGRHRVPAMGAGGPTIASGVYLLHLVTEHDGAETRRVAILR